MVYLKPYKPEEYRRNPDKLLAKSWIYQVSQYLALVRVSFGDKTKISLTTSFLTGNTASRLYTRVMPKTIPETWIEFENCLLQEFVLYDSVLWSSDKLRWFAQRFSISS